MTYAEAQIKYKKRHGIVPKTCWIAHVKSLHGKTRGPAHNRMGKDRKHPCPEDKIPLLEAILRKLGMI